MALGKLLTAALLISTSPAQAQNSTFDSAYESLFTLSNIFNRMVDRMNDDEKEKHEQALLTALNNLDNGERVKWYNDATGNHGMVEVMATMNLGGRLCRKLQSSMIIYKSKRFYETTACLEERNGSWSFSYK
jgi:surface antigen